MGQGYTYIQDDDALAKLVPRVADAARVAVDTEADGLHSYAEKVCLLQITVGGKNFIVDPISKVDIGPLLEALAPKPIILHGADYDLRMLRTTFGFRPGAPVFDTNLAAQLLGIEKFGLQALVERYFNEAVSKEHQRSDWSKRPLSPEQLAYAAQDTMYLEPMAQQMEAELEKLGRTAWHREWCDLAVASTAVDRERDPDEVWRIKSCQKELDRFGLAILKEMWKWREQTAQVADCPPYLIMSNAKMLDIAKWVAAHPDQPIEKGPTLPRHIKKGRLDALHAALRVAKALKEDEWPSPIRQRRDAMDHHARRLYEVLRKEAEDVAKALELPTPVVAPRAKLEAVARGAPRCYEDILSGGHLMKWQAALLETPINKFYRRKEKLAARKPRRRRRGAQPGADPSADSTKPAASASGAHEAPPPGDA